jgi:DNA-binding NtrC family response regulator
VDILTIKIPREERLKRAELAFGATVVPLRERALLIGRSPHCNLTIADSSVSSVHCEVHVTPDGAQLRDLGSRNGTWIGGARVREATLHEMCTLVVGSAHVTFRPIGDEVFDLGDTSFGEMVGVSAAMRRVFHVLREAATANLNILLLGESGTGKDLAAAAIHEASGESDRPYIVVDCTGMTTDLALAMLFGAEGHVGAIAEARGGTLVLDEVGELPEVAQQRLQAALSGLGASVRVVSTSRKDLTRMLNAGAFRSDLFFALAELRVELPPLRARRVDALGIVHELCSRTGQEAHAERLLTMIQERFALYDWPGNVRELLNVATAAIQLPDALPWLSMQLPLESSSPAPALSAYADAKRKALDDFERDYFSALSLVAGGNVSEMSRRSGLARHHVRAYLRKHSAGAAD